MPDLSNILQQLKKRQSHVKHEFQSFALMLAEKLNDKKKIPMYMKLAKSQPRNILNQALSKTLDSNTGSSSNRGRLFLWYIKELKKPKLKSVLISLVPKDKQQKQILLGKVMSPIYRKFRFKEMFYMIDEARWNINLFSEKEVPAEQIDFLIQITKDIRQKYVYPLKFLFKPPIILWGRTLCLTCSEPLVFRSYYSIRKKINDSTIKTTFPVKRPVFYLTLGRLKKEFFDSIDLMLIKENLEEIATDISTDKLLIKMNLQLIESCKTSQNYRHIILN